MKNGSEIEFYKSIPLFKGLTEIQLSQLEKDFVSKTYGPNELIIKEGELATDLYIIKEGSVNVLKWDDSHLVTFQIGKLLEGETFGEMGFLGSKLRSTSIKTNKKTTVIKLSRENLAGESLDIILLNIAHINAERLRTLNARYVKHLHSDKVVFEKKQSNSKFLFFLYFVLFFASTLAAVLDGEFRYFLPWLLALPAAIWMIRDYQFKPSQFGLNLTNLRSAIFNSVLTVVITISIYFLITQYSGNNSLLGYRFNFYPLFNPMNFLFGLIIIPVELISRGILQTLVKNFLDDTEGLKTIFFNALFLFIALFPLGFSAAFAFFLLSLPLGYIYSLQNSLIGVFIIHYTLYVLGLFPF